MRLMADAEQLEEPASLKAAQDWLEAAADEEWELAWSQVEPAYRRVLAERAVAQQGLDLDDPETSAIVEDAAEEGSEFGEDQCLAFLEVLARPANPGWIIYPQPMALDCELVLLVDAADILEVSEVPKGSTELSIEVVPPVATEAPAEAPPRRFLTTAILFYMRRDDYGDWLLAGFGEQPPDWLTPG